MRRAIILLSSMVLFFAFRNRHGRDADQGSGIDGDTDDENDEGSHYIATSRPPYRVPPRPRSNRPKQRTRSSKMKRWAISILVAFLVVLLVAGASLYLILQPHLQLLSSELSSYNEFSGESLVAQVKISRACSLGKISFDITYFDRTHHKDHTERHFLPGDRLTLQGEIILSHDGGILGLHSGYKITSLITTDSTGKKKREILHIAGDDAFLRQVHNDFWNSMLVTATTNSSDFMMSGTRCGNSSEKTYDVYVSQKGFHAAPVE